MVTELPPGTSAQKVLEEIEELTNPKVKAGKKALSPEQVQLKATVLAVLDAVRDESDKDAPVRLVFEPRSRTVEQDELITALLAHTSLEGSVPRQPDDGRARRPADAEEPAPDAGRVDRTSARPRCSGARSTAWPACSTASTCSKAGSWCCSTSTR